jgi:GNAT superfamily N-acetyltransferase
MEAMDGLSILALAAEVVQQNEEREQSPEVAGIRRAMYKDIPHLGRVERSAAELFRTVKLDHLLDHATTNPSFLAAMIDANHLWVAVNGMDEPIGFVGGVDIENNFHIAELSVAQRYQGRGVGKALMWQLLQEIRREGFKASTLTTFKRIPWNGPWYKRMGFSEVSLGGMGNEYLQIWQNEARNGLDMDERCLMRKVF